MTQPILLRASDAAAVLGVEKSTLYSLVASGTIPPSAVIRIPGVRGMKFDYEALEKLKERWRVDKSDSKLVLIKGQR